MSNITGFVSFEGEVIGTTGPQQWDVVATDRSIDFSGASRGHGLRIDGYSHDYNNMYTGKELRVLEMSRAGTSGDSSSSRHSCDMKNGGELEMSRAGTSGDSSSSRHRSMTIFGGTGELHLPHSTGLEMYDFHARFYDPQLGRWHAPDPAEQFSNSYLAMGNNPVMYTDPNGEWAFLIPLAKSVAIGAGIGGAGYVAQIGSSEGGFSNSSTRDFMNSVKYGALSGAMSFGIGQLNLGQLHGSAMHAFGQGALAELRGRDFESGMSAGFFSSMMSASLLNSGSAFGHTTGGNLALSGLAGGLSSHAAGGNFWQGFGTGMTVSGLNHLMHPWLTPSKEFSQEQYDRFSESRKAKFVERPKRALVQIDRQSMANYPTAGSGVHVENTTTTEIWGSSVYVKQKNLMQTMSVNNQIGGGVDGHVSTTIFWRVYKYYNSGLARDLSMLNYIHGAFNPGYHQTHIYTSPALYPPGGAMAPYLRWFNFGRP